jgi:hypothetical protein
MEVGQTDVEHARITLGDPLSERRIPEPASRISVVPSMNSTSTEEVLPP